MTGNPQGVLVFETEIRPKLRVKQKFRRIDRNFLERLLISSFFSHQGMSLKFGNLNQQPLGPSLDTCKFARFFFRDGFCPKPLGTYLERVIENKNVRILSFIF